MKSRQDLRGYFAVGKAEDAGGLTPTKDDNEAGYKIDRKGGAISWKFDYNITIIVFLSQAFAPWGGSRPMR